MTIERPMRGIGPLVMISSPTQESDPATRLAQELGGKGCRVTLESEREGLGEELDRSLDGMEVFIQLRTKNSGTVAWLDGRLRQAMERQEHDGTFILVPVALDGNTSGTPFGDWVYVDASPQGLGWPSSLDLIARTALSAVHVLPLSKTSGLEFDPEAVRLVLDRVPRDLRRVICDPEDIILSSAKRMVEHAQSVEMPIREAVSRQQEEFVLRVERQLLILDAVLHKLVTELHAQHVGYSAYDLDYHDRAARSIDRFSRLTLWRAVNRLSEWPACLDERGQALFDTTAAKVLQHIAARSPGDEMHALASWALGPRRDDGCDEFVEVEVTAPGKSYMRWYLPRTVFGKHWREILMFETSPRPKFCKATGSISFSHKSPFAPRRHSGAPVWPRLTAWRRSSPGNRKNTIRCICRNSPQERREDAADLLSPSLSSKCRH